MLNFKASYFNILCNPGMRYFKTIDLQKFANEIANSVDFLDIYSTD